MGGLATPFTNHQQHTNTMSTANHSASKYRNQTQKLEDKQSCGAHQTDNGRVGWDHQIHTSRLPRMIRNHMYTRLYQAPCQLCLTTSLLATDGISHEGPRFFTLVQPWRTSMSVTRDYSSSPKHRMLESITFHEDIAFFCRQKDRWLIELKMKFNWKRHQMVHVYILPDLLWNYPFLPGWKLNDKNGHPSKVLCNFQSSGLHEKRSFLREKHNVDEEDW